MLNKKEVQKHTHLIMEMNSSLKNVEGKVMMDAFLCCRAQSGPASASASEEYMSSGCVQFSRFFLASAKSIDLGFFLDYIYLCELVNFFVGFCV